jgi:hypothetical protein
LDVCYGGGLKEARLKGALLKAMEFRGASTLEIRPKGSGAREKAVKSGSRHDVTPLCHRRLRLTSILSEGSPGHGAPSDGLLGEQLRAQQRAAWVATPHRYSRLETARGCDDGFGDGFGVVGKRLCSGGELRGFGRRGLRGLGRDDASRRALRLGAC